MKKMVTAAAFGLGYVLGTKAGRERYEQIRKMAQSASKNFEPSDVLRQLESYRARLEAHTAPHRRTKDAERSA